MGRAGRADTDVTDPFGRGPAAAAACAAELDALLDVIVPRLAGLGPALKCVLTQSPIAARVGRV